MATRRIQVKNRTVPVDNTAEPDVKKEKLDEKEKLIDNIKKSLTFILPMTAVYAAYYNLGPAVALYRFPQMSPPVAGLFAAMLFMPFVGLFWHLVSHLWPVHNIQKSMWTFVFILVVIFATDYYFYRQAHPELYASAPAPTEQKLVLTPEQLLQQSLGKYTTLKGIPKKIVLDKEDNVEVDIVRDGDNLYYLSAEPFLREGEGNIATYESYIDKLGHHEFSGIESPGGSCPIFFRRIQKSTIVYVWIENKNKPLT